MKKLYLIIPTILILSLALSAQQWTDNLDTLKTPKEQLTFFDYQKAFDAYWDHYDVENGYYFENGEKIKAPGWKQFKRWSWKMDHLVDGEGNFPSTSTAEQMEKYYQTYPDAEKSTSGNWTNIGYNNTNGGYQGIGRVNCIAFHPSNTNTYWLGAPSGGLWRTTDNGSTWTVLTDNNAVLGVSAIAITSNYSTSNTLYIGTGDRDGGSGHALGGGNTHDNEGIGVLKSTNGGTTWTSSLVFTPSQKVVVYDLLIDPGNNNILYAATGNGLYKTINAGTSWTQLTTNVYTDLEFKPGNSTIFYGAYINPVYISKFTSSGATWTSLLLTGSSSKRTELAVSANNSNIVYALTVNSTDGLEGIYKSTDSGVSYSLIFNGSTLGNNLLGYDCTPSTSKGQGWYDVLITANPGNANDVWVGGINLWRSTNGGTSWTLKSHWETSCSGSVNTVHADQHCCEFQPGTSHIFIGNDGGIYKSTNNGTSWTDLSNTLTINQIYRLGLSPQTKNEIIIGLQDNGTHLYSGGSWITNAVLGGDGMECLIHPTNTNIQFGEFPDGEIIRTADHWTTAINVRTNIRNAASNPNLEGHWVTPMLLDPNNSNNLFVGYDEVWKSTDQGVTSTNFSKISNFTTSGTIRSLQVAPSNSNYIYAGFTTTLWKTTNGGTSWTDITTGLPVTSGNITYIAVKKDNPNTVWVTIGGFNSNSVYQTTNGGTSWTNISTGLPSIPAMSIVQNTLNTSKVELYVAMTQGVWVKYGTSNWTAFKTGLPNVFCSELEIYYDNTTPSNSKIRVATFGRGLWESDLPLVDFTANNTLPASTSTTVSFTDLSTNSPTGWSWTFSPSTVTYVGGTNSFSKNPQVQFINYGAYNVTLTTSNAFGTDSRTKTAYIHVGTPGIWTGTSSTNWSTSTNWQNHKTPGSTDAVTISAGTFNWPVFTGNFSIGSQCGILALTGNSELTITGNLTIPSGKQISCSANSTINVGGDLINYGTFTPGTSTVKMIGSSNSSLTGNATNNGNLTTTYLNGAFTYPGGYFDVVASGGKNISVNSFDIHCITTGPVNVEVWYKTGTYAGNMNNPGVWTQLGSTKTIIGGGWNNQTTVNPGASITIPSGSTYGFYINCYSGGFGYLRFTAGNNTYSNSEITINTGGMAQNDPVGSGTWTAYTMNASVYYSYITSNTLPFYDLEIDKSNASVTTNGNLNIGNDFTIKSGAWFTNASGNTINVGGNMLLEGSSSAKGSYIENGSLSVTGSTNVKSYYSDARWHFITSPVTSATSNVFAGIYMKEWDESNYVWNFVTSTSAPMTIGKGFEIWSTIGNPTVSYTGGSLNTGNVSPTLTATDANGGGIGNGEGWNLVGNPYPSAIDWGTGNNPVTGYVRTNLDNSVYIWNGFQYASYNPTTLGGAGLGTNGGSRIIQSMQSFFVKANNFNPALTIPNGARTHSSSANLKTLYDNQLINLTTEGNGFSDEIWILVEESSTNTFDSEYDAYKLWGIEEAPQLYVITPDNNLSVHAVPEIVFEDQILIGFKAGIENTYTLNLQQIENFEEYEVVMLDDLLTGISVNLLEEPLYSFTASPSEDPERFRLRFTDEATNLTESDIKNMNIYAYGNSIYVQLFDDFYDNELTVFNLLGQEVGNMELNQKINKFEVTNGTGFYLVEVRSSHSVTTKKILIK